MNRRNYHAAVRIRLIFDPWQRYKETRQQQALEYCLQLWLQLSLSYLDFKIFDMLLWKESAPCVFALGLKRQQYCDVLVLGCNSYS